MTRVFYMVLLGALLSACDSDNTKKVEKDSNSQSKSVNASALNSDKYYPNGQIKLEGKLDSKGLKNGKWTSYFENGQKNSESVFKNGVNHGASMVWYPNGNVRYFGDYHNGERTGDWVFYNEKGEVIKTDSY